MDNFNAFVYPCKAMEGGKLFLVHPVFIIMSS